MTRCLCIGRLAADVSATVQAVTAGECDIIGLGELSRLEDDLTQDHNRLINQVREQLHRYFPQLLQLRSTAKDAWLWDLIEMAPVPPAARKLRRGGIEGLLNPGLERPTDVAIFRSLPGVGRIVATTLLAEASQAIADRDHEALRSYAGVAPVTRQSGTKRIVVMQRGCHNRLRNAVYHWPRVDHV